jgi:replicative DNA helicase
MLSRQKVGLLVFDYLQLVSGPKEVAAQSRQQEVAYISRSLKALAQELRIPVVALCQLNRGLEERTNKRPQLSDLRESGAIEQDADLVMMIHRPGLYQDPPALDEPTQLLVSKNRNGPVGDIRLTFLYRCFRFESYIPEGLA